MYTQELVDLFEYALQGAKAAQSVILQYYKSDIRVEHKSDDSPVTKADKEADRLIRKALVQTHLPIISEEHEVPGYADRKNFERYWLVDPLDGTKDFIRENDEFTINIALIEDGFPLFGLLLVPVSSELYVGGKEFPSLKYVGPLHALNFEEVLLHGEKLPLQSTSEPTLLGSRSSHFSELITLAKKELNCEQIKFQALGSSLKLAWLAEGKADIYIRKSPAMEWDIAAGQAIVEGAKKQVNDFSGNRVSYNKESLLSTWFIAR